MTYRLSALLAALALSACNGEARSEQDMTGLQDPAAGADEAVTEAPSLDERFFGRWVLTGQECDEDGGMMPTDELETVSVTFSADGSYEMTIAGWISVGEFATGGALGSDRLQMRDTRLNFDLQDGKLYNGSEGEAVYLCTNVFEREEQAA